MDGPRKKEARGKASNFGIEWVNKHDEGSTKCKHRLTNISKVVVSGMYIERVSICICITPHI